MPNNFLIVRIKIIWINILMYFKSYLQLYQLILRLSMFTIKMYKIFRLISTNILYKIKSNIYIFIHKCTKSFGTPN